MGNPTQDISSSSSSSKEPPNPEEGSEPSAPPKPLPKGVVLGKDGKPCRTCTSIASWRALTKKTPKPTTPTTATTTTTTPAPDDDDNDCPPDVNKLGQHTWTLLHSMSGAYPERASPSEQNDMRQFLNLFGKLYPCWVCAEDFQDWMRKNQPRLAGRSEFGMWLCQAHNEVNRKLGKEVFDCRRWEERWRTGWRDGRCG